MTPTAFLARHWPTPGAMQDRMRADLEAVVAAAREGKREKERARCALLCVCEASRWNGVYGELTRGALLRVRGKILKGRREEPADADRD